MRCPICNQEVKDNAKFCAKCGNKIPRCPHCGKIPERYVRFCTEDGTPLPDDVVRQLEKMYNAMPTQEADVPVRTSERKNKKRIFPKVILGFILLLLILAGMTAYLYFSGKLQKFIGQENGKVEDTSLDFSENPELKLSEESDDQEKEVTSDEVSEIDVEECVGQIRERYNDIVSGMSSNAYEEIMMDNGITAYYDGNNLKSVIAVKGTIDIAYSRSYYYDGDELIFAYYEGQDAHRFYFENNQLIRWRYTYDISEQQNAQNHDLEETEEYNDWQQGVLKDALELKSNWEDTLINGTIIQEYVLHDSNLRYLSKEELECLTEYELKIARNEIYARHGRIFADESLMNYFSQFDWYEPTIDPDEFEESMLNEYEIANRDLIVQYEKEQGYR